MTPQYGSLSQLFGAPEIDEDVSPDFEDPELAKNGVEHAHVNGNVVTAAARKMAIRPWAESIAFEARPLFDKVRVRMCASTRFAVILP